MCRHRLLGLFMLLLSGFLTAQSAFSQTDDQARQTATAALSAQERYQLSVKVFRGDFNNDGKNDAIAFAYYGFQGGNGTGLTVMLLESSGSAFKVVKKPEVFGDNPRNVKFSSGAVTFDMTVPKPNDPRCCPTGFKTYRIPVGTGAPAAQSSDPLQGRICRNDIEYISLKGNVLTLDSGGDTMTFRNVKLTGCTAAGCTYVGLDRARWTVKPAGSGIDVLGTVFAGGGQGRYTQANLRFPSCKRL